MFENIISMRMNAQGVYESTGTKTAEPKQENKYNPGNLFDWEILTGDVFDKYGRALENFKHLYRSDNGQTINVSTKTYTPTTNARFSESVKLLAKQTGFNIAQVAEVEQGKKVMAFLQAPENYQIAGHNHKMFMLVGNSHDTSTAFFVGQTAHMVRCSNQFTQMNQSLKAYHTSGNEGQIFNIERSFDDFQAQNRQLKEVFQRMERVKPTATQRSILIRELLDIPKNATPEDISSRKQNQVLALNDSIQRESADIGHNLFGLFNGVTHYTTHGRNNKNRVFGNAFGTDYQINRKAYNLITDILEGKF